jgi:hypothetical protein
MAHRSAVPLLERLSVGLALSLAVACTGSGARRGSVPDPPRDVTITRGVDFDTFHVAWTPSSFAIDRYELEGSLDATSWEMIADDIPPQAIGGSFQLDASAPELVDVSIRMRTVRGSQRSAYSNVASTLRGLRPPSGLSADVCAWEKICLAWTRGSTAAEAVRVERATYDDLSYTFGPYVVVATIAPDATSYVDPAVLPGIAYQYRVRYVATHAGAAVESNAVERTTSARTSVAPPSDVQVSVVDGAPHLTWVNQSAIASAVLVWRADGFTAEYGTTLATLAADASSYADTTAAPGLYQYKVIAVYQPWASGASAPVRALVPAAGFDATTIVLPAGQTNQFTARGSSGRWWRASYGPGALLVWSPSDVDRWTEHRVDAPMGTLFADPGILLDAAERPHIVYARAIPNGTTSWPSDIVHEWYDGTTWQSEVVAQRTLASTSAGVGIAFALAADGTPIIAWLRWTPYGYLEAAHRVGGAWVVEQLTTDAYSSAYRLVDLRASPDGTAYLAINGYSSLALWTRPDAGAWSATTIPTGSATYFDAAVLMPRPDGVTVAYQHYEPFADYPSQVASVTRAASGWDAPVEIGAYASGVGGLPWAAASSALRVAFAVPEANPDGLWVRSWGGTGAWTEARLRQTTYTDPCWVGFDAAGKLLVLSYAAPAQPGTATYVLYSEQ